MPVKIKDTSCIFKQPLFQGHLYLAQNKLPSYKAAINKVETLAEQYILLDSLFKITPTPENETVVLAVPEICTDKIITLYHASLFAGHWGVLKTI